MILTPKEIEFFQAVQRSLNDIAITLPRKMSIDMLEKLSILNKIYFFPILITQEEIDNFKKENDI